MHRSHSKSANDSIAQQFSWNQSWHFVHWIQSSPGRDSSQSPPQIKHLHSDPFDSHTFPFRTFFPLLVLIDCLVLFFTCFSLPFFLASWRLFLYGKLVMICDSSLRFFPFCAVILGTGKIFSTESTSSRSLDGPATGYEAEAKIKVFLGSLDGPAVGSSVAAMFSCGSAGAIGAASLGSSRYSDSGMMNELKG